MACYVRLLSVLKETNWLDTSNRGVAVNLAERVAITDVSGLNQRCTLLDTE
jgi:hypothetical protein